MNFSDFSGIFGNFWKFVGISRIWKKCKEFQKFSGFRSFQEFQKLFYIKLLQDTKFEVIPLPKMLPKINLIERKFYEIF
jgi:hypothetical protein